VKEYISSFFYICTAWTVIWWWKYSRSRSRKGKKGHHESNYEKGM